MKIIKHFLPVLSALVLMTTVLTGCGDDCDTPTIKADENQLAIDIDTLDKVLIDSGLTYQIHNSGIRYEIISGGTGLVPEYCDDVYVSYTGTLVDGTIFDSTYGSYARLPLNNLIKGWIIGLPLIKEEGEINLYIPSSLAYGSTPRSNIPANSNLMFNITLAKVVKKNF